MLLWAALSAPVTWALVFPPVRPLDGVRLVGSLAVLAGAVAASRRQPLISLVAVVVPTIVDGNFAFGIPVMSYLVGLRMTRARPAALVFTGIALGGTALNFGLLGISLETWFLVATTLLFAGVFPWLVGRYRRQHRELVMAGWEQAELLEREQRGAAERIRMRERARIAQDMHDSLGHELSLLALRAGALEIAPQLDERHQRAAGELRASVAAATERLREIIGVLREDAEPAPTGPADGSVAELIEGAHRAGMRVRLVCDEPAWLGGDRAGPGGSEAPAGLPEMTARAVHRVVREALTNAARYAPGAPVTVLLRRAGTGAGVEVGVVNGPSPAGPPPGVPSTGSGLLALTERVRLAGGTLSAGPRDGGFAVVARLPRTAEALPRDVDLDREVGSERPAGGSRSAYRMRDARQRVRRSLLVALATPAVLAVALALVYYPIATFESVLDRHVFEQARVGQSREELRGQLPARSVSAPGNGSAPEPAGASCEYYTDGSFPLAQAAYRLCFANGRLVSKAHLPE